MNRCTLIVAALLVELVCRFDGSRLCAQEIKYHTPREVFDTAQAALQKNDLGSLCDCLTDDSRDLLAGGLTVGVLAARKIIAAKGKDEEKALLKKLDAILRKHGLTEEYLTRFDPLVKPFKDGPPEPRVKIARTLLEPVRDRNALVGELVAVLHKNGTTGNGVGGLIKNRSELTDVKIDGAAAQGTVLHLHEGKQSRSTIHFKRTAENWKIDMTAELNTAFGPKK